MAHLLAFRMKTQDAMCSMISKVTSFYEWFDWDLQKEYEKRRRTKDYFDEEDLWKIMISLFQALGYLSEQGLFHEDIRPATINVSKAGEYLIYDTTIMKQDDYRTQFVLIKMSLDSVKNSCYLAPEVFNQVRTDKEDHVIYDRAKADVWSAGMMLLQLATLDSVDTVYLYDRKPTLNYDLLSEKLQLVSKRYSNKFFEILNVILTKLAKDRPNSIKLATVLQEGDKLLEYLETHELPTPEPT